MTGSRHAVNIAKKGSFNLIAVASGLAGLGYQMVWTRLFAVALGHEIAAVLAVVAAFFVGLALGGLLINKRIKTSLHPAQWYCALECCIGIWALLLIVLTPRFNAILPVLIGIEPSFWKHWLLSFTTTFILLAPATIAMGATLPALERILVVNFSESNRVSWVYALNTSGAVIGVVISTFYLMPNLGLTNTTLTLAGLNILCAAGALLFFRALARSPTTNTKLSSIAIEPSESIDPTVEESNISNRWPLLSICFFSGLLSIGYEVVGVRLLNQILENTVYSFSVTLASYLLFNALGAWCYQHLISDKENDWLLILSRLLMLTSSACLLGFAAVYYAPSLYHFLLVQFDSGVNASIFSELVVAASIFAAPTFFMGMLFCHLANRAVKAVGLGHALAANTLGAALAPLCFGLLALPVLGSQTSVAMIAGVYLILHRLWPRKKQFLIDRKTLGYSTAILCFVVLALMSPSPIDHWLKTSSHSQASSGFIQQGNSQQHLRAYREGVLASVAVIEDTDGQRHLKVNNHFTMGGTNTQFSDHRQSHIPLLLHGNAHSVLYLGLGTGVTMDASQYYPNINVTGVELIPELIPLMNEFGVNMWPPKANLLAADARRFVLADKHQYDVIIGEIFHPSRDGAGALYTTEHFYAVQKRLAEHGIFAQWLPLFQLDIATLKTITATFLQVFPNSEMHLGHLSLQQPILCLIGRKTATQYSPNWLLERVQHPPLQQALIQTRLNSDYALFGGFLGGNKALQTFAANAPINTDDFPIVNYQAPKFVYGSYQPPALRLKEMIEFFQSQTIHFPLIAGGDNIFHFMHKMEDYRSARDKFLLTGIAALGSSSVRDMLAITRAPLLQILQENGDFGPAYRTLLGSAQSLYNSDPQAAFDLLTAMQVARPDYAEARNLKNQLFPQ